MKKLTLLTASLLMLGAGAALAASPQDTQNQNDTQTSVYGGQSTGSGYMQAANQTPSYDRQASQSRDTSSQAYSAPHNWPKNDALGGQGG